MPAELPPPKAVRDLLEGMLGRDIDVSTGGRVSPKDCGALAIYVADSLRMTAVVTIDLALAAYLGCAVGLVPVGGAATAIEDGALSSTLLENVGEILNVFASTLNDASDQHQRLYAVHGDPAEAPADALALATSVVNRLDLGVTVKGYGKGELSCILI
jgi:hypothetical protein